MLPFTNKKTYTYDICDEKKDKIFCKILVYSKRTCLTHTLPYVDLLPYHSCVFCCNTFQMNFKVHMYLLYIQRNTVLQGTNINPCIF